MTDGGVAGERRGSSGWSKLRFLNARDFYLASGDKVRELGRRVSNAITVPAHNCGRGRRRARVRVYAADEKEEEETEESDERGEAMKTKRKREMPTTVRGRRRRLRHPN